MKTAQQNELNPSILNIAGDHVKAEADPGETQQRHPPEIFSKLRLIREEEIPMECGAAVEGPGRSL